MKIPLARILSAGFKNIFGIATPGIWNNQITYRCQAQCGFCPFNVKLGHWKQSGEELKTEEVIGMADQIYELGAIVSSFEGGEPTLRQDLPEILKHCKELGFNVHIVTNGGFLKNKAHLIAPYCDEITVSIDYPDERHNQERGPNIFRQALEGIKEAKKYTVVTINTVLTEGNLKDVTKMVELTESIGANGISFEPVENIKSLGEPFENADRKKFSDTINELKKLKKDGAPILNSQKYFDVVLGKRWQCETPILQINTDPYGNIKMPCGMWGNRSGGAVLSTKGRPVKDAWFSKEAVAARNISKRCTACHLSCNVEPSLAYHNMGSVVFDIMKFYGFLKRRNIPK